MTSFDFGAEDSLPTILPDDGNYDRPHTMKFEYCGDWEGYYTRCTDAIAEIQKKFGMDKFTFML